MYLNKIMIENMGAIEKFYLDKEQLIKADGTPRVIVLVGKNGTGKTTLMSGIVDALYELSNSAFSDVLPKEGMGYKYFKLSSSGNVRTGSSYGFNYIKFSQNEKEYEYFDKNGIIEVNNSDSKISEISNSQIVMQSSLSEKKNSKQITPTQNDDEFMNDFSSNSYCYFPSDRYELPYWMNESTILSNEQFKDDQKFIGYLNREITIRKSLKEIKNWILDVFLDSRTNLKFLENGQAQALTPISDVKLLTKSIENLEKLISEVIQHEVSLNLNYRYRSSSRIKLLNKNTGLDYLPSLDNLSAGQSTLLSIFCTIIQYSDRGDLNKSINLKDIEGIVIIDEIDLHLHIELQHDVLPQLIKLFPKVQFIISSHSPFFLAGMAKIFNEDDYLMLNMPNGNPIEKIDDFEEFTKSYELFTQLTESHLQELADLRTKINALSRPLIITEGKTDWKHLKAAFHHLQSEYPNLEFDFHEYENEIEMGDSQLDQIVDSYKKTALDKKVIAIFDRDAKAYLTKYGSEPVTKINENLYAFCIPSINEQLDEISIEYYYKDHDLKRLDVQGRRLFDGKEFDNFGVSLNNNFLTDLRNKAGKLKIIDSAVYNFEERENKNNIALSKNEFAENILHKKEGFENLDFENFRKIFDIIQTILNPIS